MYTTVITLIFFFTVLIEAFSLLVVFHALESSKLKTLIKTKKVIRSLILIEFCLFNFLFSFASPAYVFQLVLQILGNIVALVYFFFDYFYFSQRIRSYILWLQSIVFSSAPLKNAFKIIDSKGIGYKEIKKQNQQVFSLVEAGDGKGLCILIPPSKKNGGLLLKPKKPMDEKTLMFYAQKIEIDLGSEGELAVFQGNLPSEAINEYVYGEDSKIYLWLRDKLFSEKGRTILAFIIIGLILATLFSYLILSEFFGFDLIKDWLSTEIC